MKKKVFFFFFLKFIAVRRSQLARFKFSLSLAIVQRRFFIAAISVS